jgi:hypothetical protein
MALPLRPKTLAVTAGGKPNPMQYCAACTRTVNTEQSPDPGCPPAPWCRKRAAATTDATGSVALAEKKQGA